MRDIAQVKAFLKHIGYPALNDLPDNEVRRFKLYVSPKDSGDKYGRPGLYAFSNFCFLVNGMPVSCENTNRVSDYMIHKMRLIVREFCPTFMEGFEHVTDDMAMDLEQCLDEFVNKVY